MPFPGTQPFLRGLVPLIGYRTDCVYYNREKRFAGESKYPFRKMLNFAIDGITSFPSNRSVWFWIGCIFILVALCVTGWTLHSYTQHNTVPGWSSLMISVWLVGGVILVSLGIVGEYIGKIYIWGEGSTALQWRRASDAIRQNRIKRSPSSFYTKSFKKRKNTYHAITL